MTDLQKLYQKKGEVVHAISDLVRNAEKEDRGLNTDEDTKFKKMEGDLVSLQERIERAEHVKQLLSDQEKDASTIDTDDLEKRNKLANNTNEPKKEDKPKITYRSVWRKYMTYGLEELTGEERNILKGRFDKFDPAVAAAYKKELRATTPQVSSDAARGGYLSPEEWANEVVESMKAYGAMLGVATIVRTRGGDTFHIPTEDTTSQLGDIIGQGVKDDVSDTTWGEKTMSAWTYTSKIIKIAEELYAEDDAFDVLSRVGNICASRVGRKLGVDFTTGGGTTEPWGVVTRSTLGVTAAAVAAITRSELLDLKFSVDPAYGNGTFMMNYATLGHLAKLAVGSADDRPLWVPSMREGVPDMIEGSPYVVNQHMASLATGQKTVLYGDMSKYWIREVRGMTLSRSDQRFWDERVVAYFMTARYDGELADTAAIKHLIQA